MISLKSFNKKELEDFIVFGEYRTYEFLPITSHRALSQIKNPVAAVEDVLLTLAFEEGKLAGYLGTFPNELKVEDKIIKYAWLSTLYVNENFRGKRIAQQLLDFVFEKYEGKIAITEFTKEAESLYAKTKMFDYIAPKLGKRFYFRTNFATIIPNRKPKFAKTKPALEMVDSVFDLAISFQAQMRKSNKIQYEISDFIDEESERFLTSFQTHRTPTDLKWIIENPWVLEGNQPEKEYLFSSTSKQFGYFWVKIFDKNRKLKTVSLLQLRDGNLKIPYFFAEKDVRDFANFLQNFIREKKVKTLISYHEKLNEELSSRRFRKLYQKDAERRYLYHKNLIQLLPLHFNPKYQDGDGDAVFT